MLGTDIDRVVARRLGRSLGNVQRRRTLLRVAPYGHTSPGESTASDLAGKERYHRNLAGLTIREIADQDGVSPSTVSDSITLYRSRM